MIDRRGLIVAGAALAGAALAGPVAVAAGNRRLGPIGIQLYTLREIFQPDPVGTLRKVAKLGYREVEYGGGGYTDMDPALLRRTMDRLGLKSPSIHISYEMLGGQFDQVVGMARTLGADTIVVPWIAESHRTADGWARAIEDFNRLAGRLQQAGLGFAYHNHDFEFTVKHGGRSMFDQLIEARDPALVKIELDLFWAVAAGEDPASLIRRLPGQIYSYHVKDRGADGAMTSVGKGVIDFAAIFALNDLAGVRHFYVENDESPAPYIPDIRTSLATLRAIRF